MSVETVLDGYLGKLKVWDRSGTWSCLLMAALGLAATSGILRGQCGGEERWPVKMGSDSRASQVSTNPVSIDLHSVAALARPDLPADNETRVDGETNLYVVDGRLRKFKPETGKTGDGDYHLVITDDTLQFSAGGSGQPSPHSLIAEVVNPECVAGRAGDLPTPSFFQAQLVAVRTKFEEQFPHITGGWNDAGGVPVRITGIGFFDRPHGQVGRALNGIEIHPVLDISFGPGAEAPPAAPAAPEPAAEVLQNPGFEDGPSGWRGSQDVITNQKGEQAHSGTWKAWLGGYGTPNTTTLYQQLVIPANASAATISFYLHVSTEEETTTKQNDVLKVQIRDANGHVLATPLTFSNLQASPGFKLKTVDLTAYRGQTIRIYFTAKEDQGSLTSFVLDDFRFATE
jgi:hypothetical protein